MSKRATLTPNLGPAERAFVFAIAMKYVKNEIEADDVTQEALLLAHRHRDTFAGRSRYSTWLYRVAATAALMHLRKGKRHRGRNVSLEVLGEHADTADLAPDPRAVATAREELARTANAAASLRPKYRKVFELRFGEGKSDAEVAERLGLTVTSAKTRAFRARAKVRERLRCEPT